jgi:hypothetical protein
LLGLRKPLACLPALVLTLFVLAVPPTVSASHNVLQNGTFTSGIDGWSLETDSGFDLAWDPSMGSPSPGSLRLSGTYEGFGVGVAEALSECVEPPLDTTFHVQTAIFADTTEGDVKCVPFITRYEGPGCTGERTRLGFPPPIEPTPTGAWLPATTQASTLAALPSFRVSLFFWILNGEGVASCNFDSVVLFEEGVAVADIPVASDAGLLLLVGLLGLSATWLLRTGP